MPSLREAAVHYAELGYAVLPLKPRTKDPASFHGVKDATTEVGTVEAWWIQNPNYNIGIACGPISHLVAIDVDVHPDEGKDGWASIRKWEVEHGELPETWQVLTSDGGSHFWYRTDLSFTNTVSFIQDVDIRSEGSYVVAPPSVHPNGSVYEWDAMHHPDDAPITDLSGSALELLQTKASKKERDPDRESYRDMAVVKKGFRQDALMNLQGLLLNLNLSDEAIETVVRMENEAKCDPPMTETELKKEIFPFLKRNIKPSGTWTETVAPASSLYTEDELDLPTLDKIKPEKAEWFEGAYIPAKSITILCGTGGVGKTSIWCSIAAAVSRGEQSFLTASSDISIGQYRENRKVMFFSAEDSVSVVLVNKLQKARAVLSNIMCLDVSDERFRDIKLSSPKLEKLLDRHRPALCIFDPIQAFIDKKVKMSDRNAMRQEIEPLIKLGQKYGTTFLIVMHTNKQSNVWGRQRMADSSDIWDVARSVLMVGNTDVEDQGYISQEKNSYARQAETILFQNAGGIAVRFGTSPKKDRDFVLEASRKRSSEGSNELQDAMNLILSELSDRDGKIPVTELDELLRDMNYSSYIIRNAKRELKKMNRICMKKNGYEGKNYICTV